MFDSFDRGTRLDLVDGGGFLSVLNVRYMVVLSLDKEQKMKRLTFVRSCTSTYDKDILNYATVKECYFLTALLVERHQL